MANSFSRDIISETRSWEQVEKKQGRYFNFQNLIVLRPIWNCRIFSVQYINLRYSHWHEIIQIQLGLNSLFFTTDEIKDNNWKLAVELF